MADDLNNQQGQNPNPPAGGAPTDPVQDQSALGQGAAPSSNLGGDAPDASQQPAGSDEPVSDPSQPPQDPTVYPGNADQQGIPGDAPQDQPAQTPTPSDQQNQTPAAAPEDSQTPPTPPPANMGQGDSSSANQAPAPEGSTPGMPAPSEGQSSAPDQSSPTQNPPAENPEPKNEEDQNQQNPQASMPPPSDQTPM